MERELTEREKSRYGPRALKTPGSPEWCWQTVERLVRDHKEIHERYEEVDQTLKELIIQKAWKIIPSEHPYGTIDAMLLAEVGGTKDSIQKQVNRLRLARSAKAQLANMEDEENLRPVGSNQYTEPLYQTDEVVQEHKKAPSGNSTAAILRRLRKDYKEIFAQVLAGEITPRAGAVKAGFRKNKEPKKSAPQITCPHCGGKFSR